MPVLQFSDLRRAPGAEPEILTLTATDGTPLAFRVFAPARPRMVLVLCPGGGAHGGAGYALLAGPLAEHHGIAVVVPDLRGHGRSGGTRGDLPHAEALAWDLDDLLAWVRQHWAGLPLVLGGHSSGAGLVLNYASRADHASVQGYLFLAPQLGFRARTDRPHLDEPFAKVNLAPFLIHAFSGGVWAGHRTGVKLGYPQEILGADPLLVNTYSVFMANAVTPTAPERQLASLDRPLGLFIGDQDELFDPARVTALGKLARRPGSTSEVVLGARHLSILSLVSTRVAAWMETLASPA